MPTVLMTGGTGMTGTALTKALLSKGYKVIILTRSKQDAAGKKQVTPGAVEYASWNVEKQTIDATAIAEADHIIHLAGAGVADKRWTAKRKQEILDSRVKSGELLVKALKDHPNKVRSVVSACAIGWYGPDPVIPNPHPFTENDPPAHDFLGQTCQQWESSLVPVTSLGKRLVQLRTGIVLSKKGGALDEFKKPLRFGIATILGSGKQVVSWIHIDDLVGMYIAALENDRFNGVYNAVASNPVSNKQLVLALARTGRFFIPVRVPSFLLKWVLGEMSIEVLKSATVSNDKALRAGFTIQYPFIQEAVQALNARH